MLIEIPDDMVISEVQWEDLPENWYEYANFSFCQKIGDAWVEAGETAVLRVPSSIIQQEYNYIINIRHPDFARIRLAKTEDFKFDPRIREGPDN